MAVKVIFTLGYILLGVAIVRARVLPRSVGTLLAVGAVAFNFGNPVLMMLGLEEAWGITAALLGVGLSWFGYALWTNAAEHGERHVERAAARGAAEAS